jgi:drug/metabolite transporter (DMT)-like permease
MMLTLALSTGRTPSIDRTNTPWDSITSLPVRNCARDVLLSCVLAVGVNVTNYQVLTHTSPLTFQTLGHLKTAITLAIGFVVFNAPLIPNNLLGMVLAFSGLLLYAYVQNVERDGGGQGDNDSGKPRATSNVGTWMYVVSFGLPLAALHLVSAL